jgi:hypothetical protein
MKQNIGVVLVTIAIFLGGLVTGIWTQRTRVAAAPFPLLHEFGDPHFPGHGQGGERPRPSAETEQAIAAYEAKVAVLREKYHARIAAVLDETQRAAFAARHEGGGRPPRPEGMPGAEPRREFRPGHGPSPMELPVIGMIFYRPLLDLMAADLKLTAEQRQKIDALLLERRAEFLQLIDQQPPPTFLQGPGAPAP